MRAYLVDWLAELHYKFKMLPETLHITVGLIDRYLEKEANFSKKELQVLGITALHIAGKYEEIYPPDLKTLIKVTDGSVTKESVIKLEYKMLLKLDFDVTWPSIHRFLERYCRISQVSERTAMLAQYFCETALLDITLVKERPSLVASIGLYAANKVIKMTGQGFWNATLTKNSGYREDEVRELSYELLKYVKKVEGSSLKTFSKKYQQPKFMEVSKVFDHYWESQQQ